MAPVVSIPSRRGNVGGAVALLPLLLLLMLCLACIASSPAVAAEELKLSCSYCQERGYPYLCHATMESGTCFSNAGEINCNGAKGCTCCRLADAAGCTFCSMEAEWDTYDDGEEDI